MSDETIHPIEIINNRVKAIVERETLGDPFWTQGEIRGVYQSDRGHVYFHLEDNPYSIRCMLPEDRRATIDFTPQSTMEVEVYGTIQVYAERAMIEIMVEKMRLVKGQQMSDFASVEEQLRKKGKYPNQKQPLPRKIENIALLTSRHSEAYFDFNKAYYGTKTDKKNAVADLIDVRVQGEFAPKQITEAIARINRDKKFDIIVITRGGGKRSDMTIFDDILIAEAIIDSAIPIVTAIGHERDDFFADRVADIKRNTPTDAGVFLAREQSKSQIQLNWIFIVLAVLALLVAVIAIIALNG